MIVEWFLLILCGLFSSGAFLAMGGEHFRTAKTCKSFLKVLAFWIFVSPFVYLYYVQVVTPNRAYYEGLGVLRLVSLDPDYVYLVAEDGRKVRAPRRAFLRVFDEKIPDDWEESKPAYRVRFSWIETSYTLIDEKKSEFEEI